MLGQARTPPCSGDFNVRSSEKLTCVIFQLGIGSWSNSLFTFLWDRRADIDIIMENDANILWCIFWEKIDTHWMRWTVNVCFDILNHLFFFHFCRNWCILWNTWVLSKISAWLKDRYYNWKKHKENPKKKFEH